MSAPPSSPAAGSSCFPDFFLLDTEASISDLRNETTAAALTEAGLAVQVSFAVADPPRLSSCCVYCPNSAESPFDDAPEIICSVEDAALIRVDFTAVDSPQYFLYRARGPNGGPSLDLLPLDIRQYSRTERLLQPLGFVSHDNNRKQFVMAALSYGAEDDQYNLHTIGSDPHSTWSKTLLQVGIPCRLPKYSAVINPTQVIGLGGGLLGWVDLWRGIVICDVLEPGVAAATASFVPMPKLLGSNRELYGHQSLARPLRDVNFSSGCIRCVEFEELVKLRPRTVQAVPDAWDMDELHDSELALGNRPYEEEDDEYDVVGWRLITWCRELNWNGWRKGNMVHSDDLGIVSLPQLGGGGGASAVQVSFKDLKTAAPTLRGDDVVYLVSMLNEHKQTAWIVTVDTKRKSLGEVMPFSAEEGYLPYDPTYIPCVLTNYLDAKLDGAQVGMRNAYHAAPRNISMSEKKRQRLSQTVQEEQEPASQLLQPSSVDQYPSPSFVVLVEQFSLRHDT